MNTTKENAINASKPTIFAILALIIFLGVYAVNKNTDNASSVKHTKTKFHTNLSKMNTVKFLAKEVEPLAEAAIKNAPIIKRTSVIQYSPTVLESVYGKPTSKYIPLIAQIKSFIAKNKGHYGIYFVSLSNNVEFGINADEEYVAASTIKVPINLYIYDQIVKKKINPYKKLTYTKEAFETGTGSLQYQAFGTCYTIKELQKLSIVTSDNVATNMLINFVGLNNILNYEDTLVGEKVIRYRNISNPRHMAIYLKELLNFAKINKDEGTEFLTNLKNTIFNDRLPYLLPKNVPVAHKIGNVTGSSHDVGIIYAQKPYILTVMSKNIMDSTSASDTIAHISKLVYDFEQNIRE